MENGKNQSELTKEMIMNWLKENWKPIYYIAKSLDYKQSKNK
jgi:hypothetical protein